MELRILVAYALILAMALAAAALAYRLWYYSPRKAASRQRVRDRHRYHKRLAERQASQG